MVDLTRSDTRHRFLERVLKDFHAEMTEERGNILFMQDGAPSHRDGRTKEWLRDHNIPLLFHPPSSPDLNPIEPVWHKVKKIIWALPKQPGSVKALQEAIHQAWKALPIKDINKYIKTMGNHCSAVKRVKEVTLAIKYHLLYFLNTKYNVEHRNSVLNKAVAEKAAGVYKILETFAHHKYNLGPEYPPSIRLT